MRTNLKVMDSADVTDATSAQAGALTSPLLEEQLAVETARGAERASLLRRLLLMSDVVAGSSPASRAPPQAGSPYRRR